jgi:1,4-dihydroxy-2-naphthoate octaprenyltransferase
MDVTQTQSPKPTFKDWLQAARLRTLPLAFSSIITGSLLAASAGPFRWSILVLALLTTLLYQVLSNYANDYGDGIRGTDANKVGEQRAIAAGKISVTQMRKAILALAIAAFWSGTLLSILALQPISWALALLFVGLGLLAVLAAITYTVGAKAYAYIGLGDLFVLLFFGWLGVCGSYFIQAGTLPAAIWLPATAIGLLSAGVLNLNNMRDMETDTAAGKKTLALRLGLPKAKVYHLVLLLGALVLPLIYVAQLPGSWPKYLFLFTAPLIIRNGLKMWQAKNREALDQLLKPLAITTLLFSLLLGLGVLYA